MADVVIVGGGVSIPAAAPDAPAASPSRSTSVTRAPAFVR